MKIYSQLEVASYENLASDPSLLPVGRMWLNTTSGRPKVNLSAGIKQFMFQDDPLIVGTNGTAATNGKFHRGGVGIIQSVLGNDATAEGSSATSFAQLGFRLENFTFAGKPATGNIGRAIYATDTKQLLLDDGTDWSPISGTGGGGVENFVTNPSAEINTTGWSLNSVAAATRPAGALNGTNAGLTFVRSTVAPLNKDASFRLSKDAVNRQGQLVLTNMPLPAKAQAKMLEIRAEYKVVSGTFVAGSKDTDSDLIVYIREFNGTTYKWTEPTSFKFFSNSTTLSDTFSGEFQTQFDTISADLVFFVASTSALAWEIALDDVTVSPQRLNQGSFISNWSEQETTTGSLTNAIYSRKWRQEGDSIRERIRIEFTGSPGGTNPLVITLKNTVNTSKLNGGAISNAESMGVVHFVDSSTGLRYTGSVCMHSTNNQIRVQGDSTISGNWGSTNPFTVAVGDFMEIDVLYPALGYSSSVKMSEPGDDRPFLVSAVLVAGQTIPHDTITKVNFNGQTSDTQGSYDSVNNRYRIFSAGTYRIHGSLSIEATTTIYAFNARLFVNGVSANRIQEMGKSGAANTPDIVPFDFTIDLKAGDYVEMFCYQGSGVSLNVRSNATAGQLSVMHIERDFGSQQNATNDKVQVMVNQTSGQSIPNNSEATVIFNNVARDTHGIYNPATGRIKLNRAAFGTVKATLVSGFTGTGAFTMYAVVYKNGSAYKYISQKIYDSTVSAAYSYVEGGSCDIEGVAGDEFWIAIFQNTGSAKTLNTSPVLCWADFKLD